MTSPTPSPNSNYNPANPMATPQEVNKFHGNSDVDSSINAQHHTMGIEHNQASPGDHKHDGKSSKRIGKGLDLSFPLTANAAYTQAQIQSIINALRSLGFGS
jgi:hypothetical protein